MSQSTGENQYYPSSRGCRSWGCALIDRAWSVQDRPAILHSIQTWRNNAVVRCLRCLLLRKGDGLSIGAAKKELLMSDAIWARALRSSSSRGSSWTVVDGSLSSAQRERDEGSSQHHRHQKGGRAVASEFSLRNHKIRFRKWRL